MSIQFAGPLIVSLCLAIPLLDQEPRKTLRATGRVTAVAPEVVTIQAGSRTLTFAVDTSTRVIGKGVGSMTRSLKSAGHRPAITDLVEPADSVTVTYVGTPDGRLHATQIKIEKKRFRKR
jgi:hypothetical protein